MFNKSEDSDIEGYGEFVSHMLIAQINMCLQAKKLHPLIDRRQSFGFMTPTITNVHTGVRFSLGLTPNKAWIDCVTEGIAKTDRLLEGYIFKPQKDPLLDDKFRGGELTGDGHKYLNSFARFLNNANQELNLALCTLFLGKTKTSLDKKSIRAIFRSVNAGKELSHEQVLKLIEKKLIDKYFYYNEKASQIEIYELAEDGITHFTRQIDVEKFNYFLMQNFLSIDFKRLINFQAIWLHEAINASDSNRIPDNFEVDEEYRYLYEKVTNLYKKILNEEPNPVQPDTQDLEKNTRELVTLQNRVVRFLVLQKPMNTEDTSEDEDENEYSSPRYNSPSGMSALYAPLVAANNVQSDADFPFPYTNDHFAYFELALSWNKTLSDESFIRLDKVIEQVRNKIYKYLLENGVNTNDKKEFYSELVDFCIVQRLEGIDLAHEHWLLFLKNTSNLPEEEYVFKLIIRALPAYFNKDYVEHVSWPQVWYLDNNPCSNKKDYTPQTANELLKQLSNHPKPPRILVLDVTSSTQMQINQFLNEFNQQESIPILVTASSMVKHSEIGHDLWQG